ncbi:MAG: M23 family metallopeptidase [Saprospiraceae bacterium]|nr:M23 family metallopeptidase [Saprospiraceae bacterium]
MVLGLALTATFSQAPSPTASLRSPVRHPIRLSGTFGELRSNHFHAGLDIKSEKGTWGDPVYAIDEGYIARISVSPGGYGRALYINHLSGLTSVYGHLQSFIPEVEAYVLKNQLEQQSFAIDLKNEPGLFKVLKGQQIANMGSTGYSLDLICILKSGLLPPKKNVNPQLFQDFEVIDVERPIIKNITIYSLDHQLFEYNRMTLSGVQKLTPDTLTLDAWRVAFGMETFDPHNGGQNKNGIYSASVKVDDRTIHQFRLDTLSRDDVSYYDIHIDYAAQTEHAKKIHRCFRLPNDMLSIYAANSSDGVLPIFRDRIQKITLLAADVKGNSDSLTFYVKRSETVHSPVYPSYQYQLKSGQVDTIKSTYMEAIFAANSLFQDLYCQFGSESVPSPVVYSARYKIHHGMIPLKAPVILKIRPFPAPDSLKSKLIIASVGQAGQLQNSRASWAGPWLSCQITQLGSYQVMADIQPPSIKVLKSTITSAGHQFIFQIDDDLSPGSDLKYRATLNDQWLLAEYDLKNNRVVCNVDRKRWPDKSYQFKLLVEDAVANKTTYDYRLHFK